MEDLNTVYRVLVNNEQQYSIWPDYKEIPAGWTEDGYTGTKDECMQYINTKWTDFRPPHLRGEG